LTVTLQKICTSSLENPNRPYWAVFAGERTHGETGTNNFNCFHYFGGTFCRGNFWPFPFACKNWSFFYSGFYSCLLVNFNPPFFFDSIFKKKKLTFVQNLGIDGVGAADKLTKGGV
jgi:hypothetical protein